MTNSFFGGKIKLSKSNYKKLERKKMEEINKLIELYNQEIEQIKANANVEIGKRFGKIEMLQQEILEIGKQTAKEIVKDHQPKQK